MLLGRLPGALKAFEILLKIDRDPSVAKGCASFIVICKGWKDLLVCCRSFAGDLEGTIFC